MKVAPIKEPGYGDGYVHILFREVDSRARRQAARESDASGNAKQKSARASDAAEPSFREAGVVIRQLSQEPVFANEQRQTTVTDHKAANGVMRISNDQVRSVTKELSSTTEELEPSKEELQSANEELLALNQELKSKIEALNGLNGDLQNLMNVTEIGTIFLDSRLRIRRFTPRMADIFEIEEADLGRRLDELTHRLDSDATIEDVKLVASEHVLVEREVRHALNRQWFLVRLRPYRTVGGDGEGVVITFIDVTAKGKYDEQLEELVETLEALLRGRSMEIKQLASQLIFSEQTERQRVAQILHDDLQPLLYAFQSRMVMLVRELSAEQGGRLAQATALIDDALRLTRALTVELSPPMLKREDITVMLDWLAIRMKGMHELKIEVEYPGPINVPPDMRMLVYQLVRELLFNVVKHARVDRARVSIDRKDDDLVLTVEDEGVGFDVAARQEPRPMEAGGIGLRTVRQRLQLLGGRFDVTSIPGHGMRASLQV